MQLVNRPVRVKEIVRLPSIGRSAALLAGSSTARLRGHRFEARCVTPQTSRRRNDIRARHRFGSDPSLRKSRKLAPLNIVCRCAFCIRIIDASYIFDVRVHSPNSLSDRSSASTALMRRSVCAGCSAGALVVDVWPAPPIAATCWRNRTILEPAVLLKAAVHTIATGRLCVGEASAVVDGKAAWAGACGSGVAARVRATSVWGRDARKAAARDQKTEAGIRSFPPMTRRR